LVAALSLGRGEIRRPVAVLAEHEDHRDREVPEGGDPRGQQREHDDDDVEADARRGQLGDGRDLSVTPGSSRSR
jgi:hypothetical protein